MRRTALPVLLLPLALLVACGSGSPDGQAAGTSASASESADVVALPGGDAVMINLDAGDGTEPVLYSLACPDAATSRSGVAVPGPGTLPEPEAACAQLQSQPEPFAPLPDDVMCTQLFGGPQTAHVAGTWAGERVDLQLSRTDGCRIAQWDRLGALLPGPTS